MDFPDPEGRFFDTILVGEYHSKYGYNIEDVKSIDIWKEVRLWQYSIIKHFDDLHESAEWLHSRKKKLSFSLPPLDTLR